LLGRIVELVTPGGQMWFSTNRRKFAFDGANISPECTVTETTDQTIPADFSQKRPHRSYRIDVPA
jgi:23S rRNA G2069 N7-methylase RlmK/C1962 C5-methylase RlmI